MQGDADPPVGSRLLSFTPARRTNAKTSTKQVLHHRQCSMLALQHTCTCTVLYTEPPHSLEQGGLHLSQTRPSGEGGPAIGHVFQGSAQQQPGYGRKCLLKGEEHQRGLRAALRHPGILGNTS